MSVAPPSHRPIRTTLGAEELRARLGSSSPWFYRYRFANGVVTDTADEATQNIHLARAELILPLLDLLFEKRWPEARCLDLACHEGWFAVQLALRGASEVLGVDIRPEHVSKADTIKDVAALDSLQFLHRDLYDLEPGEVGAFDVTLFLGVLYHLDNPLEALRLVRSLTRGVAVIETQIAKPGVELETGWGAGAPRLGPACALIEADSAHVHGEKPLVFVPTLDALRLMMFRVGFTQLYLSLPAEQMADQYVTYERVVVIAQAGA